MSAGEQSKAAQQPAAKSAELLQDLFKKGFRAREPEAEQRAKDLLQTYIDGLVAPNAAPSKDAERTIKAWVAEIDRKVSLQLNTVMHQEEFKKLEASWRGLEYLVKQSETGTELRIKVLNTSKTELLKDLEKKAWDQSILFKKVYEHEYGTFGGHPFGCLIGDFEFGKHPQDMALLQKLSHIAAQAHAPFLSSASSDLFNLESYTDINEITDIALRLDSTQHIKWKSFREDPNSRYVGLCLPHILLRLPWGRDTKPIEEFDFEEAVDGKTHEKYLWGNAAYALGLKINQSFAKYGWFATIRGVQGGGLVENLPTHTFRTDKGTIAAKCPTEVLIPDRREKELSDQGFIPLVHCKNTDKAAFFAVQSCQKAKKYDDDQATASAALSTQLQYLLCVSRFAHYLKAIARDRVGSFMEVDECRDWLNRWIKQYTISGDSAGEELKARHPLREAVIEVKDNPAKPGYYEATAFLRPHFQLEALNASLRLVAEVPKTGKG